MSGADQIAEQWAKEKDIPCMVFKAEWQKYGKAAGPKRNKEMLDFADEVIAFHDNLNSSKGTKHMVSIAREANIPTVVYP